MLWAFRTTENTQEIGNTDAIASRLADALGYTSTLNESSQIKKPRTRRGFW